MAGHRRPPLVSISLLACGILIYEILLMRLFAIIQWHHFAYMVISLALLGYGMSGTFVSISQTFLSRRYSVVFIGLIMLFGLSSLVSFLIAQSIPFNALEILWDRVQIYYLLAMFLILALPFFFGSSAICLTLLCYGKEVTRIYGFDLCGAGIGSIAVIVLFSFLMPQNILIYTSGAIILIAGIAAWELDIRYRGTVALVSAAIALALLGAVDHVTLKMSPYKGLVQHLRIQESKVIEGRSSPLGLINVLESPKVPLRHVPGMSLNSFQEPLEQLGVFTDGDNLVVITAKAEAPEKLAYLDQLSSALPFHLRQPENVLILGAGAGTEILQAGYHGAEHIDAVELNPQIPELVRNQYADFAGNVFDNDKTELHIAEIREFVKSSKQKYDVIQLSLTDGFTGSAAGVYALSESYLYTVEGIGEYVSRLSPGGYLAITRWIKMPPRDTFKIFATGVKSLRDLGVAQPEKRLVLIRSWQTSTLLIKNGEFDAAELQSVEKFSNDRSFDVAYSPSVRKNQVNRYSVLQQPLFYLAATELLSKRADAFMRNYKFAINPATDNQPYFHHFFKWSSLLEILRLREQGSAPLLESGYLVLIVTLVIAVCVSSVLILLPLWIFKRESLLLLSKMSSVMIFFYFFVIGMAFFFVEIAFLQKFILFLHHPVYSITTGLAAFLVFAGIGSYISGREATVIKGSQFLQHAVIGIAAICIIYLLSLDHVFALLGSWPTAARIAVSVVLIAPLGVCMGIPFPVALKKLACEAEQLVPWAWGINGCASVISASLATLIAIHFGFTVLIILAVILYLVARWTFTVIW